MTSTIPFTNVKGDRGILFERVSPPVGGRMSRELPMKVKPGVYLHYKGIESRVIGEAKHSETLEEFVIYEHPEKKTGKMQVWIRPKKMFLEKVIVNGKKVPRFKYLSNDKSWNHF